MEPQVQQILEEQETNVEILEVNRFNHRESSAISNSVPLALPIANQILEVNENQNLDRSIGENIESALGIVPYEPAINVGE